MGYTRAYANQKEITINKPKGYKPGMFSYIGIDEVYCASQQLKGNEFKVWIMLMMNKSGFGYVLSPAVESGNWGIPKDSIQKAVQGLKKKGFLVPKEGSSTKLDFYPKGKDNVDYEISYPEEEKQEKKTDIIPLDDLLAEFTNEKCG